MVSPEVRLLVARDPEVRAELRAQIDAARRKRVKRGSVQESKRVKMAGPPCNAVLGPFSSRPGEKCGRSTAPGNIFCKMHGGAR